MWGQRGNIVLLINIVLGGKGEHCVCVCVGGLLLGDPVNSKPLRMDPGKLRKRLPPLTGWENVLDRIRGTLCFLSKINVIN